jgi:hypothetical protein
MFHALKDQVKNFARKAFEDRARPVRPAELFMPPDAAMLLN